MLTTGSQCLPYYCQKKTFWLILKTILWGRNNKKKVVVDVPDVNVASVRNRAYTGN